MLPKTGRFNSEDVAVELALVVGFLNERLVVLENTIVGEERRYLGSDLFGVQCSTRPPERRNETESELRVTHHEDAVGPQLGLITSMTDSALGSLESAQLDTFQQPH